MKLTIIEQHYLQLCLHRIKRQESVQLMRQHIHHGCTTTYLHCERVACYSYWVSLRLHLHVDAKSLICGAFLHDFYLYDWHKTDNSHHLHGFHHPAAALQNAREYFHPNSIEEDIIVNHMWPLTLTKMPRSCEAIIVCLVDKWCSISETLHLKNHLSIEK